MFFNILFPFKYTLEYGPAWHHQGWPYQRQGSSLYLDQPIRDRSKFLIIIIPLPVEGLYCKRPIQCLASSKNIDPPPPHRHRPASVYPLWCGGRTHSLDGEGVGVNSSEFGRRQTLLCICKNFVPLAIDCLLQCPGDHIDDTGLTKRLLDLAGVARQLYVAAGRCLYTVKQPCPFRFA
jgi:hypothetical protein